MVDTAFDSLTKAKREKIIETFKRTDPNQADENLVDYARTLSAEQLDEVLSTLN